MTKIEWVKGSDGAQGKTWNPIVGCSIVSPGCTNCYAMKMAARLEAIQLAEHELGKRPILGPYCGTTKKVNGNAVWTGEINRASNETLLQPLKRNKPTTYFVNSMSDLFHEDVPDAWIDQVFAVMALCPQHTFQVLTKRAKRMREYMSRPANPRRFAERAEIEGRNLRGGHPGILAKNWSYGRERMPECHWPLPNVWLGVSTERQKEADERIPLLLQTPAAVRFISAEPMLGPIDLTRLRAPIDPNAPEEEWLFDALAVGDYYEQRFVNSFGDIWFDSGDGPYREAKLDWVIVGGESGPGSRPMHPDWARSLRDQCSAAGVPFFFKQWGEWAPQIGAVDGWAIGDNPEISRFDHREWEGGQWSDVFRPMWCDFQDGNYDETQTVSRIGKKRAGRLLDGFLHDAMPERRA